jgi:hypothetical protein
LEKSSGIDLRISPSSSGVTVVRPRARAKSSTRCITTPRTNEGIFAMRSLASLDQTRPRAGALP